MGRPQHLRQRQAAKLIRTAAAAISPVGMVVNAPSGRALTPQPLSPGLPPDLTGERGFSQKPARQKTQSKDPKDCKDFKDTNVVAFLVLAVLAVLWVLWVLESFSTPSPQQAP